MKVIDQIEKIRTRNNKNWMDILRVAMKYAPGQTKIILRDINECDKKIGELLGRLGK